MDCRCHGEPAYWQKDAEMRAGGFWRCAVKKREQQLATDRARAEIKNQRTRDRYDNDPIFRIEKRLHDNARRRALTLKRRKEEHRGQVQAERLR